MLLSMFTSFLLARRFRMKIFLPLITAVILFISCFSLVLSFKEVTGRYYPLSFPLYSIEKPDPRIPLLLGSYEVYFLNYRIYRWSHAMISYDNGISVFTRLLSVHYFLFINIAGAILGYGLNKAKSIWRYFSRRKELLLVTIMMVVSIIGISAVLLYKIQEPKHVKVTARIVEKDILRRGFFGTRTWVFKMDNGDLVEVSITEFAEYEIGDTYIYCTCRIIRL